MPTSTPVSLKIILLIAGIALATGILAGCGHKGSYLLDRDSSGTMQRGELDLGNIPVAPEPASYVITYGDHLDVHFLYNVEFSKVGVRVRPDGKISYPYVGELTVAGMTTTALDSIMTARFSEIVRDPDITVMVSKLSERYVYILGEVKQPGGYSMEQAGSLVRAIAVSGGATSKGKRNSVLVIRRVAPDRIVGMQIDYQELLSGHNFELDIPLKPFDIVYMPKNWISRVEDYSQQLYHILVMPMDLYLKGWQVQGIKVYYEFYERASRPVVTPE
jgi:polysaccharide export outer membrane protein